MKFENFRMILNFHASIYQYYHRLDYTLMYRRKWASGGKMEKNKYML
jgi:hypothetical protein